MNPTRAIVRGWWREAAGAVIVLVTRILTAPRTPWENDEFLFAEAVRNFDPSRYHPHPPGYPLFVLLGKFVNMLTNDPWRALVVVSILSAPVGFVALARAFRNWTGDADLAFAGALLYYFSASMLVHGTLALSDGAAMMFVALALHAASCDHDPMHERHAVMLGVWSSCAIGTRPQLLVPLAPMLLVCLIGMKTMRQRVACVLAFAFISTMWFLPLADAAGGLDALRLYETKQAQYVAAHDAAASRGAMSFVQVTLRFLIHSWGSKYLSIPLLACFALGFATLIRRARFVVPLLVFTAVHCLFELTLMDPADAARYNLAAMMFDSLVVAWGLGAIRRSTNFAAAPYVLVALFAAGTYAYVRPIVGTRTVQPSPPVAAAQWANAHVPPNAVIAYDLALRPHAEYLLSRFTLLPVEKALAQYYDRSDVPLYFFANGSAAEAGEPTFAWPASDAYGKLTRKQYRQVTIENETPAERYLPLRGVYAIERTDRGDEWRWLAPAAAIRLPRTHGAAAELTFHLSPDAPFTNNAVRIAVNGRDAAAGEATPSSPVTRVPLPPGDVTLEIRSARSFVPDVIVHNQDRRALAVELRRLITR